MKQNKKTTIPRKISPNEQFILDCRKNFPNRTVCLKEEWWTNKEIPKPPRLQLYVSIFTLNSNSCEIFHANTLPELFSSIQHAQQNHLPPFDDEREVVEVI